MKEFDPKKEALKENYNYFNEWAEQDKEEVGKILDDLPRGVPRTGIKGKYIKKKGNVGKLSIKKSYGVYKKESWKEFTEM